MHKHVALYYDLMDLMGIVGLANLLGPVAKQWRAIHVEDQQSHQSDLSTKHSEVIIQLKSNFLWRRKRGQKLQKKNKFHNCLVDQGEKRLVKFRETIWFQVLPHCTYTPILRCYIAGHLKKWTDSYCWIWASLKGHQKASNDWHDHVWPKTEKFCWIIGWSYLYYMLNINAPWFGNTLT